MTISGGRETLGGLMKFGMAQGLPSICWVELEAIKIKFDRTLGMRGD